MSHILFDYQFATKFFDEADIGKLATEVKEHHRAIHDKTGAGNEFLGWVDLPLADRQEEFAAIQKAVLEIHENSDVVLFIGIGGSYLGAKAALEMLQNPFYNMLDAETRKTPQVFFVGHHMSGDYLHHVADLIKDKTFSIVVISKSGTTTEPAIAFRFFRKILRERFGREEASKRIYAITDQARGALKTEANQEGYQTFVIPDDIGGRYSVLTAVGLLPMAIAGIDSAAILEGAKRAAQDLDNDDLNENMAYQYAVIRNLLYRTGKNIELLVNYEPALQYFAEWWKQLFGESEGKEGKGIFPASVNFTTDLHSLGQYIQDGRRELFETVLKVENVDHEILLEEEETDLDNLNYLAGHTVSYVNQMAFQGTLQAHVSGGVPNLVITIPRLDAYTFGYLAYFFEKACAMSGYLLGVNPFDQPGVEDYKRNMFALLGKK